MNKLKNKIYSLLNNITCFLGIENRKTWIPFLAKWFFLSLIIHFIIAIFSTGFYHWDEHYQILEFLSTKLYGSSVEDLPWEYRFKMRSWTQPGLYFLIAKFLNIYGVENPVTLAFFFRLFTSLTGWFALCSLCFSVFFLFKEEVKRKWAIILLTLTWYIPYIQTRASSEGLGSNLFILGLSMMTWGFMRQKLRGEFPFCLALASGIFFGLSFTFRFQLGILVMFCWSWAFFFGKASFIKAFSMAVGIIMMILLEILVDYWGYETWTFAPWNYIQGNLNLIETQKDNLRPFMYPWWSYFTFSFIKGIPPISLLLIVSQLLFWLKRPLNLLTWASLPLFLIHSMVSIKDMRYLFPIAILTPLTLIELPTILKIDSLLKKKWIQEILRGIFAFNIILLIIVCFKPARPIVNFYNYIYENKEKIKKIYLHGSYVEIKGNEIKEVKKIRHKNILYVVRTHPYKIVVKLPVNFYKPKGLTVISSRDHKKEEKFWYFMDYSNEKINEMKDGILLNNNFHCKLEYLNYPQFLLKFNLISHDNRKWVWGLFHCQMQ